MSAPSIDGRTEVVLDIVRMGRVWQNSIAPFQHKHCDLNDPSNTIYQSYSLLSLPQIMCLVQRLHNEAAKIDNWLQAALNYELAFDVCGLCLLEAINNSHN